MRILHVLDHSVPIQDGYSYRTLAILREQRNLGWETVHLTSGKQGDCPSDEQTVDGFHFYRTPPTRGLGARLPVYQHCAAIMDLRRRLADVVNVVRPDLIHAHSPALNGVAAIAVGRARSIPVNYELRSIWEDAAVDQGTATAGGPRYRLSRALETWVLRNADHVTTISEGLRAEIVSRGVAPERLTTIPNGADPDEFPVRRPREESLARELGVQGYDVVGFIGSLYAYEGVGLLVQAMARLVERRPVKALLVGGGQEADTIARAIAEHGLGDSVRFLGRVPREEVPRYYDLLDVAVYPRHSMRLTELVTPMKPLEAMARGNIVLASDVGGHRELVRHRDTGYLFAPDDVDSLVDAIEAVLEDRAEWPAVATRAMEFVARERSWRASVERYREPFARLAQQRPRA